MRSVFGFEKLPAHGLAAFGALETVGVEIVAICGLEPASLDFLAALLAFSW